MKNAPINIAVQPRAFLLDMDGVLYHGSKAIPHAVEFMQRIQSIPHVFITNNPTLLPQQIADKLTALGFPQPSAKQIITSAIATANYLHNIKENFRYFAMGAEGLHRVLQQKGQVNSQSADFVIVGEGEGIDFNNLVTAINLVQNGARLISTNPDNSVDAICAGKPCILPGGGALVAPIQIATGVKPITIGKPHPLLYQMALQQLNLPAAHCMMIGDRPDTDIAGANKLGLQTALVRTGRLGKNDPIDAHLFTNYDVDNLYELRQQLALI